MKTVREFYKERHPIYYRAISKQQIQETDEYARLYYAERIKDKMPTKEEALLICQKTVNPLSKSDRVDSVVIKAMMYMYFILSNRIKGNDK